jgi:5-formyltetrahydrofolate cyclo-ligase
VSDPADEPVPERERDVDAVKRTLRREMREMRKQLPDRVERSIHLWSHVRGIPAVRAARTLMVFASVPGEPETAPFIEWCRSAGKHVVLPEDESPPDPARLDVVVVPGTAFTADGRRLGQGGGWYDRFLPAVRPDCTTIGVGFDPQVVDHLPMESHDVRLDMIVTESGVISEES